MEIEAQPLLLEDEKLDRTVYAQHSRKISRLRSWAVPLTTHGAVALLVLLVVTFSPMADFMADFVFHYELWNAKARPTLYSPLNPAIKYTIDHPPWDSWSNPLFFGPPSDDSEIAWNNLIHPHGLQVLPEEAKQFDETNTVRLKNGNYLFILGLYHNLHCLRRVRQTLQADIYYPNMTAEQREHDAEHTGHCLEAIRTSMMCHPDLTPNRFYWSDRAWHDLSVSPDVTRECVDWSRLEGFMKDRTYDQVDIVKEGGENLDIETAGQGKLGTHP